MNIEYQIAILLIISFVFILVPIFGIILIFNNFNNNKKHGKDFDLFEETLCIFINNLSLENLHIIDGQLSDWLDTAIKNLPTYWFKNAALTFVDIKSIGMGEFHRAMLENDETQQSLIFNTLNNLASSFGRGDKIEIIKNYVILYAFLMCTNSNQKIDFTDDLRIMTTNAISKSLNILNSKNIKLTEPISEVLEYIEDTYLPSVNIGLFILILRWTFLEIECEFPNKLKINHIIQLLSEDNFNISHIASILYT